MPRKTILIIDDEDPIRVLLKLTLQSAGYDSVLEASNGEDGLALAMRYKPDLILLDLMMPGMDGETLCNLAKERYPSLRVILMSGYSEDFARHGKDEDKNFSFLPKPFSLNQLVLKVREVLQKKE